MTIILEADDLSNGFLEDEDFSILMCGDKGKVLWAMSAAQVWGGCQGDFGDA